VIPFPKKWHRGLKLPRDGEPIESFIGSFPTYSAESLEEMAKLMKCVTEWRSNQGLGLFREDIYGIDIDHALYALCRSTLKEFERDK
jgi:hypothetical protein